MRGITYVVVPIYLCLLRLLILLGLRDVLIF